MKDNTQALLDFLKSNPNATKAAIAEGINLKGLPLFNLLKKLIKEGTIIEDEAAEEMTYTVAEVGTDTSDVEVVKEPTTDPTTSQVAELEPAAEGLPDDAVDTAQVAPASTDSKIADQEGTGDAPTATKGDTMSATRDSSKYMFNGEELGKGPLVRAVVAQYVMDNKGVTYEQLKTVFPDTLLKRFGIFQDVDTATVIAKGGRRYFTKPEQMIKLEDTTIVVTNQFTLANIQPFLEKAKELGFVVD